jgi:hypothetical protein
MNLELTSIIENSALMAAYNIEDLVISLEWTLGGEGAMLQAPIFACLPRVQCSKCFGGFHEAL